jgi:hypothetical protein
LCQFFSFFIHLDSYHPDRKGVSDFYKYTFLIGPFNSEVQQKHLDKTSKKALFKEKIVNIFIQRMIKRKYS